MYTIEQSNTRNVFVSFSNSLMRRFTIQVELFDIFFACFVAVCCSLSFVFRMVRLSACLFSCSVQFVLNLDSPHEVFCWKHSTLHNVFTECCTTFPLSHRSNYCGTFVSAGRKKKNSILHSLRWWILFIYFYRLVE